MFVDLPRLVRAVRCQGARGAEACGREAGVREKVLESLCGGAGGQPNDVDTVSGGLLEGVSWGPGGRYKVFTMLFWLDWKRKSVWGEEERSKVDAQRKYSNNVQTRDCLDHRHAPPLA